MVIRLYYFFLIPLLTACTSFLYYPESRKYIDEQKLSPGPRSVYVKSTQDSQLMSWFFEANQKKSKPITVIFTHGNGQNMSTHFRSLYWLLNHGINYLIVGYPGYGPNAGSPSPETTVEATTLAMDWVFKNRPNDAVFLFGQSLGGNVALQALSESSHATQFCGVGIESSFASYKQAAQGILSKHWLLWSFQWLPYLVISDTKSIAKNFKKLPKVPYLVIHGDQDQVISNQLGQDLFDQLPEGQKVFWPIKGGRHINTFIHHPRYREQFLQFIQKHCLS